MCVFTQSYDVDVCILNGLNEKLKIEIENCTILIPKGNSYCRRKSSARGPQFKVSSKGLGLDTIKCYNINIFGMYV